jgi:hypothetical protein
LLFGEEPVGVDTERRGNILGLGPQVRGQVGVRLAESGVGSLDEILGSTGVTSGTSVHILDTGELQDLLWDGGSDNTGTAGSGGKLDANGTTLTGALACNSMDLSNFVTPETAADGNEVKLGNDKSALDSNLDFLGDLDAETDVTILVTDNNNSLKAGTLSSLGLLLDGNDLHNLIREGLVGVLDELVHNRCLLDRDRVSVNLFERLDTALLNEATELGHGNPVIFV